MHAREALREKSMKKRLLAAMKPSTHRRGRALGGLTVAVASLLLGAPQQLLAQTPAASARQPAATQSTARHVVTLITGDRVIASGANLESVRIEHGPGRDGVAFTMQRVPVASGGTHLFVIPADAAPLLSSGKVDRRLFDVTLLIESRYDDASCAPPNRAPRASSRTRSRRSRPR